MTGGRIPIRPLKYTWYKHVPPMIIVNVVNLKWSSYAYTGWLLADHSHIQGDRREWSQIREHETWRPTSLAQCVPTRDYPPVTAIGTSCISWRWPEVTSGKCLILDQENVATSEYKKLIKITLWNQSKILSYHFKHGSPRNQQFVQYSRKNHSK